MSTTAATPVTTTSTEGKATVAAVPAAPPAPDPVRREYLVFAPRDGDWRIVGTYETFTPEDALSKANAALADDEQGKTTLVPVAARNWQPRTPVIEPPPPPKLTWK